MTTLQWISVTEKLPDSDLTVMVYAPDESESVWMGYFDEGMWRDIEGRRIGVTHWAPLPDGPRPTADDGDIFDLERAQ